MALRHRERHALEPQPDRPDHEARAQGHSDRARRAAGRLGTGTVRHEQGDHAQEGQRCECQVAGRGQPAEWILDAEIRRREALGERGEAPRQIDQRKRLARHEQQPGAGRGTRPARRGVAPDAQQPAEQAEGERRQEPQALASVVARGETVGSGLAARRAHAHAQQRRARADLTHILDGPGRVVLRTGGRPGGVEVRIRQAEGFEPARSERRPLVGHLAFVEQQRDAQVAARGDRGADHQRAQRRAHVQRHVAAAQRAGPRARARRGTRLHHAAGPGALAARVLPEQAVHPRVRPQALERVKAARARLEGEVGRLGGRAPSARQQGLEVGADAPRTACGHVALLAGNGIGRLPATDEARGRQQQQQGPREPLRATLAPCRA